MKSDFPLGVKIMFKEGIPKDTVICQMPKSKFWLELQCRKKGHWRIHLCDPSHDRKRLLTEDTPLQSALSLMDMFLVPHKERPGFKQLLETSMNLLKSQKSRGSTKPKKSKNPGIIAVKGILKDEFGLIEPFRSPKVKKPRVQFKKEPPKIKIA
jgi:hypothetical protein